MSKKIIMWAISSKEEFFYAESLLFFDKNNFIVQECQIYKKLRNFWEQLDFIREKKKTETRRGSLGSIYLRTRSPSNSKINLSICSTIYVNLSLTAERSRVAGAWRVNTAASLASPVPNKEAPCTTVSLIHSFFFLHILSWKYTLFVYRRRNLLVVRKTHTHTHTQTTTFKLFCKTWIMKIYIVQAVTFCSLTFYFCKMNHKENFFQKTL